MPDAAGPAKPQRCIHTTSPTRWRAGEEHTMAKTSKATTPIRMDFEVAEDRACELEDYTVNFVTIRQDHDLAPMLASLPGGVCRCPHWGVMLKGRMTARYAD